MSVTILEWKTEFNDTQRLESDVAPIIQGDADIFGYWTDAQSTQRKIYASALNLGTPVSNFTYMFGVLVFPSTTEVRCYVNNGLQRRDTAVQNNGVYSVTISQTTVNDVNVPHNMSNYFTTGTTQIFQRYEGLPLYEKSEIQDYYNQTCAEPVQKITSNGGGATHIAKVTGQLKDLSSNLSDILMVSGGGGGGLLVDDTDYSGKDAGGISGSGDNSADQSTGNAFGQGESGTNVSGGGSGLYGGYKGTSSKSGGAGSGYIGNSLLSNKKMVGYNVPTSSAESTKTESVNEVSASAVSGKPKSGNGFARIKFLRDAWGGEEVPILWAGNSNKMTVQISNNKIVFKLYSGNLLIYSFDAYVGATIIDADNIYVHFLIDSEQELAKPSMIYDNNSVLSYNQEEPTDEEMADIYTWVSAGLPSE